MSRYSYQTRWVRVPMDQAITLPDGERISAIIRNVGLDCLCVIETKETYG